MAACNGPALVHAVAVAETEHDSFAALLRRIDENPSLMSAFRAARRRLPGDEHWRRRMGWNRLGFSP